KHGSGVYTWGRGKWKGDRYEGEYRDGKFTGRGVYTWANGNRYEGEFKNNDQHGRGVFSWANGDRYEGGWASDRFDGSGVVTWQTGSQYKGIFKAGSLAGALRNAKGPAGIIGQNDRTSRIPDIYRPLLPGIGSLRIGRRYCTAFCIGPDAISTSQHCVQSKDERWHTSSLNYRYLIEHKGRVRSARIRGSTAAVRRLNFAYGLKKDRSFVRPDKLQLGERLESDWAIIRLRDKICPISLKVQAGLELSSRTALGQSKAAIISAERFAKRSSGKRWSYSGVCNFPFTALSLGSGFAA
ncbi:unnamed protein product, partial [marine sediment metagenome]